MNKSERSAISSALDAIGAGDTAAARGILAALLDSTPRKAPTDAALRKADDKVREVLLSHTWQYVHEGTTTTGTVWAMTQEQGGRWVVNAHTGALHKVLPARRYGNGRSSDGHSYTGRGLVADDCPCKGCAAKSNAARLAAVGSA